MTMEIGKFKKFILDVRDKIKFCSHSNLLLKENTLDGEWPIASRDEIRMKAEYEYGEDL